jgi:hypothetical protein
VTKIEATIIHPRDRVLSEINPFMNINKVKNFDVKHIDIELSKNDIQMYNTTLESAKKL